MTDLEPEEREVLEAYHEDRLEHLEVSAKEIEAYRVAARATSQKEKRVNIRISARDLEDLRIKAMEEGLPYQTLMASVLHKYATGRLISRP